MAAIFQGNELKKSKTIHQYQPKISQLSKKHKQIENHHFQDQIKQLFIEWKENINKVNWIWIYAPGQNSKDLFFESVLSKKDERIRNFPIADLKGNANLKELERNWNNLMTIEIFYFI